VAAVTLIAVCAIAFVIIAGTLDSRTRVLQVVRPIPAGHVISAGDLRQVTAGSEPGLGLVAATDEQQVVGRPAAVPMTAGTLLTDRMLGTSDWPPPGQVVGSVALAPGRVPPVAPGDRVTVYLRPGESTTDPSQTGAASSEPAAWKQFSAVVVAVDSPTGGEATTVLSLLMPAVDGGVLAQTGDDGVLVVRGEGR